MTATRYGARLVGQRYERRGLLAIKPQALSELFFVGGGAPENVDQGDATIVDVRGPLEQHAHPWFDSYEAIRARVQAACAGPARAVVMRFDSPGGEAAGCFDTACELRAMCDAAGKQLYAYIEGDCCSAAYAMACCAQWITIGSTALCGSIGVLCQRDDYSAMNAQAGLRVALIASGARKADGHPDQPITDAELAASQGFVNSMGQVFFDHVAQARGLAPATVAQLQAAVLHGDAAISAGLVDEVGSLSTVLTRIASGGNVEMNTMASAYEKAKAALDEASKTEDANGKAAAAALAALVAAEGGGGEDTEPEKKDDKGEGDETTTEGNEPPAGDPPADDKEKKAAASAYRAAIAAQSEVAQLRAELRKRDEDAERARLIASRPGLTPELTALLNKAPIALVREHIAALPAAPVNPELAATPTRGDAQGSAPRLGADEKRELDERMGLSARKATARSTDYKLYLGAKGPSDTTN